MCPCRLRCRPRSTPGMGDWVLPGPVGARCGRPRCTYPIATGVKRFNQISNNLQSVRWDLRLTSRRYAPTNCARQGALTGCGAEMSRPPEYADVDDGRERRRQGLAAAQSHRCACRGPGALSAHAARHEPGKARREARTDVPASPEVRERHQPHRRQPAVRSCAGAGCVSAVFLRGGSGGGRSQLLPAGFAEKPAEGIDRRVPAQPRRPGAE